jgi:hypothetical protein
MCYEVQNSKFKVQSQKTFASRAGSCLRSPSPRPSPPGRGSNRLSVEKTSALRLRSPRHGGQAGRVAQFSAAIGAFVLFAKYMISIAIKENGGALAIQGLEELHAGTTTAAETDFKRELLAPAHARQSGSRRSPHPIQLKEVKNLVRHGIALKARADAHATTARGIQFHGREQVHERSRLIVQFGAGHQLFSGRESFFKTEGRTEKAEFGGLVNFHENFSGRSRE